jgi:hypothetical protein
LAGAQQVTTIPLMNETQAAECRRRRRDFIRAHHPDRGSDPDAFIAGLRAFDTEPEQDAGPLPKVIVIRRRGWPIRQAIAVARRLRDGPRPPRVH